MSKLETFKTFVNKNLPDFPENELEKWITRNQSLMNTFSLADCFNSIKNYYRNELTLKKGQKSEIVFLFGQYNSIFESNYKDGSETVKMVNMGLNTNREFMEFEHYGNMPKGVRELSSLPNLQFVKMIYTVKKWKSKSGESSGITNNLVNIKLESDNVLVPIETELPFMALQVMKGSFIYGSAKILEVMTIYEDELPCSFYSNQELTCRIRFVPLSSEGIEGNQFEGILHLKRMRIGKRTTHIYNQESLDKWLKVNNTDSVKKNDESMQKFKERNEAIINQQRHFLNELYTNKYIWFLGKGDIKDNGDIESPIEMEIKCYDTGYLAIMEKPYSFEKEDSEEVEETKEENDIEDPGPIVEVKPKTEKKKEEPKEREQINLKNITDVEKVEFTQITQRVMKAQNLKKPKQVVEWFKDMMDKNLSEGLIKKIMEYLKNPEKSTEWLI